MTRVSTTLLLLASAVAAADSSTIVVTAERRETDAERAPVSIEVVTADEIRERGFQPNTVDWLSELPGVSVMHVNGGLDGGIARISLRGVDPSMSQILMDGIPVNDTTGLSGGLINPSLVNPAGLGRIEVLKGAQSGIWGSRAIGGVINYLTPRPTSTAKTSISVQGGSFETAGIEGVSTGTIGGTLGYALSASGLSSRGFSVQTDLAAHGDPGNHEADGVQRWSGSGRLEWTVAPDTKVYGSVMRMHANQEYDDWGVPDDGSSHQYLTIDRVAGGVQHRDKVVKWSLEAAETATDRIFEPFATYQGRERWASAQASVDIAQQFTLSGGADLRREQGRQVAPTGSSDWDETTGQWGTFAGLAWSRPWAEVSLTGRSDRHQDFGYQTSGRAAAAVFLDDRRWKVRTSVGNGFRSPGLYELHGAEGGWFAGNPDLKPEKAWSYEVGLDARVLENVQVSSTAFRTNFRQRVSYDYMVSPSTYVNVESTSHAKGVESAVEIYEIAGYVDVRAWHTWLSTDDGGGRDFYYAPNHEGGLRATARQEGRQWSWWETASARRSTGFTSSSGWVPGATVAELAVGVNLDSRWEASLRVENALDNTYEVTPGYSTSPRAVYGTVTARF